MLRTRSSGSVFTCLLLLPILLQTPGQHQHTPYSSPCVSPLERRTNFIVCGSKSNRAADQSQSYCWIYILSCTGVVSKKRIFMYHGENIMSLRGIPHYTEDINVIHFLCCIEIWNCDINLANDYKSATLRVTSRAANNDYFHNLSNSWFFSRLID